MFKEILKILPRLDNSDLNKMEQTLTMRFGRIAKKFGSGLVKGLKGGAAGAAVLGVIDRLLNPLSAVQDSIDKILAQGDDLVTNAQQFGTTAGKLMKLKLVAQSTGLDEQTLYTMINKFQHAVAQAAADPTKDSSVRQFVGMEDTAEAFFQYTQGLKKLGEVDMGARLRAEADTFGEKLTLKAADFISTDMGQQLQALRLQPTSAYEGAARRAGALSDSADIYTARREGDDFVTKAGKLTSVHNSMRDAQLRIINEREAALMQQKAYVGMQKMQQTMDALLAEVQGGAIYVISTWMKWLEPIAHNTEAISKLRALQRILKAEW